MSVKETREVIYLAKVVTINVVREVMKPNFEKMNLFSFVKSPEFEKALTDAITDAGKIPDEVTHVGITDGLVLTKDIYNFASDVIQEIRIAQAKKSAG